MTVINNDFHPLDKGLEATNDHWGTQLASNDVPNIPSPPIAPRYIDERSNVQSGSGLTSGRYIGPMSWKPFPKNSK